MRPVDLSSTPPADGDDPGTSAGTSPWHGWRQRGALVLIVVLCVGLVAAYLRSDDEPEIAPPVAAAPTSTTPIADAGGRGLVYLALGDSLSRGVQPDGTRTLKYGYPRLIEQSLAKQLKPRPKLIEAGCGGATAASMIAGGKACAPDAPIPYANENRSSSQLIWAVRQLEARKDLPTLVTITIGGNDLTACTSPKVEEVTSCLDETIPELKRNWSTIARRLSAAAGPKTVLAFATNYDPILGYVRLDGGKNAQAAKAFHRTLVRRINPAMRRIFKGYGWQLADLAFAMHENGAIDDGDARAVSAVCALTWACGNFDVHLNDEGYGIAADVFEASVLDGLATATATKLAP